MIPRYSRPEMAAIWEPQTRFRIWFEIEAHAATPWPSSASSRRRPPKTIWAKAEDATFDVARIDEIERETKHDVIAFLTHLAEIVGPEARFVHQGMTSSDVLDTCLAVQLDPRRRHPARRSRRAAGRAEEARLRAQDDADHRPQPRHPRRARRPSASSSPAYAEFARARARLVAARAEIATCAISGAVGTFANIDPRVEEHVAKAMGLDGRAGLDPGHPARPPRRCSSRRLASIASSIERLATEIRHLQRTEVREAEEFFSDGPEGLLGDAAQAQPGADRRTSPASPAWCAPM